VSVVERQDQVDRLREMVSPGENLISRLGILGLDLTPELARLLPNLRSPNGVVIAGVASDAQAPSGLVPGDVIYAVNGDAVRTLADLRAAVDKLPASSSPVLQVGRQGQLRFVTVSVE